MDDKMVFTGFDDNSFFKVGSFTVGNEYTAMSDDRARWPDDISYGDGGDGFFIDDNGSYVWESLSSFKLVVTNKTVRPIMTVEARDAIDNMHEICECETRSESIVMFEIKCNDAIVSRDYYYNEVSKWKLIAWSMTAACVALIATMMITAS